MAKAEGKTIPFLDHSHIDVSVLETFEVSGPRQRIEYTTHEFSAVCPFSGLPDIGHLKVEYVPNKFVVELKSLKYYLLSYRNVGIYQEHATPKLFKDLFDLLKPEFLKITLTYNTRGGIDTVTSVSSVDQNNYKPSHEFSV
jgi:7-cyano-7-deazaguanine reductase